MISPALIHHALVGAEPSVRAGTTRWSVAQPIAIEPITMVAPLISPLTVARVAAPRLARAPASCTKNADRPRAARPDRRLTSR